MKWRLRFHWAHSTRFNRHFQNFLHICRSRRFSHFYPPFVSARNLRHFFPHQATDTQTHVDTHTYCGFNTQRLVCIVKADTVHLMPRVSEVDCYSCCFKPPLTSFFLFFFTYNTKLVNTQAAKRGNVSKHHILTSVVCPLTGAWNKGLSSLLNNKIRI